MLNKWIARAAFYVFCVIALLWTSSLTYAFLDRALPDLNVIGPAFGLVIFDGGMLAWLWVFLHFAQGAPQRVAALVGVVVDLIGMSLMTVAEIFLGGQTYAQAPAHLGEIAIWGIGIWTMINVTLSVIFHLVNPNTRREMALRDAQDQIEEKAFQQLKSKTDEIAGQVADSLSDEMVADVTRLLTGATPDGANVPRLPAPLARNGHTPAAAYATEAPPAPRIESYQPAPVNFPIAMPVTRANAPHPEDDPDRFVLDESVDRGAGATTAPDQPAKVKAKKS